MQPTSNRPEPAAPGYNCENEIVPELDWIELGRDDEIGWCIAQAVLGAHVRLVVSRTDSTAPWRLRSQLLSGTYELQQKELERAEREAELVTRRQLAHLLKLLGGSHLFDVDPLLVFGYDMLQRWATAERRAAELDAGADQDLIERLIEAERARLGRWSTTSISAIDRLVDSCSSTPD